MLINFENNDIYRAITSRFEWSTGSARFSRGQEGSGGLYFHKLRCPRPIIVNDIVFLDHQDAAQNREMSREGRGREGWNSMACKACLC